MNDHEQRSLHERIERLEGVVEELRQTLKQMIEASSVKGPDVSMKVRETVPVQVSPDQIPAEVPSITEPEVEENLKQCPFCHEKVKREAIKCRFCGRMMPKIPVTEETDTKIEEERPEVTELPPQPSRTREEWEAFVGGKLLNRIGALALIIGIGFFLKYAFDNNWINETMRVLIGVGAGVAMLVGGAHFHKKGLHIFAQGLVGAGIPILYLSVYASFNFYNLVSQTVAFIMMSVVTIIAFQQAVRYDSFAVSLLGWFGGFLTPFLLSTGEVNAVGLFTYIVLLDIGLLLVLYMKESWAILEPLTFAATYLVFISWYKEYYAVDNLPVAVVFLTLFWGLFYILDIARIIKPARSFHQLRQVIQVLNTVLFYLLLYVILDPAYPSLTAPVTLVIGAVYFLTFLWSLQRKTETVDENIHARHALTSVILLVIATGIQFSDFTLAIVWMLESLILVWCGVRFKLKYIWKSALIVCVPAVIKLFSMQESWVYAQDGDFSLIFNQRFLAFSVMTAAIGGIIVIIKNLQDKYITDIRSVLHYGWCILIFFLYTVETNDFLNNYSESSLVFVLVVVWMIYSLPLVRFGLRKKIPPILYCGLGASALAVITAAIKGIEMVKPIEEFSPILNIRVASLVLVTAGLFVHGRWLRTNRGWYEWISRVLDILQIAIVVLVFVLITAETRDLFEKAIYMLPQGPNIARELDHLRNLKQLSLSGVLLMYSIFLMVIGMLRRNQGLRIMSIVLFGISILKIFIYDLSFLDQLYRIYSFIGLGLILLAVSYVYQRYKDVIFEGAVKKE